MIDEEGFRSNVGIILINQQKKLFWGRRIGQNAWQFPQGGMLPGETPEQTLFRELEEEVGLTASDVKVLAETKRWLKYRLPKSFIRHHSKPLCIGQKQKWFLLQLCSDESAIQLDKNEKPEFDKWRWVSYWFPLKQVIAFKRSVYRRALQEFVPTVFNNERD